MAYIMQMAVINCKKQLMQHFASRRLRELPLLYQLCEQLAALTVLQHQTHVLLVGEHFVQPDDVWVVQFPQQLQFVLHEVELVLMA